LYKETRFYFPSIFLNEGCLNIAFSFCFQFQGVGLGGRKRFSRESFSASAQANAGGGGSNQRGNLIPQYTPASASELDVSSKRSRDKRKDVRSKLKLDKWESSTVSSEKTGCRWTFVFDPAGRLCYYWSMVVSLAFLYNFWVLIYRFAFQVRLSPESSSYRIRTKPQFFNLRSPLAEYFYLV
jgi:hypothetical protein